MEAPSNPRLIRAIHQLLDRFDESGGLYREALEALIESTLIVAESRGEPATVEIEDGDALAVFTDLVEVSTFRPGAAWRTISGEAAIREVAAGDYDGLVVNPGGRSFELSRDDVTDLFEIE